jgi:hypothetical protein
MLRRIVIGLLVLAVAAFCVIYLIRHVFTSPAKTEEAAGRPSAAHVVFAELVSKHNAIDTWDEDLCQGRPARLTPVLTMELEKVWPTERSILFIGKIRDIKTEDKDNYRIMADRDAFWAAAFSRPLIKTDLQVSALFSKAAVESFIATNPDFLDEAAGIALIVKVETIEPAESPGQGAGREHGKVGKGKCVDLLCLRQR